MRLERAFLALALTGATGVASFEAPVYIFGPSTRTSTGSKAPSVSAEEARLLFAQQLSLSQYHSLQDVDESTINLLNTVGRTQRPLFSSSDDDDEVDRLMIVVEGVEKPEDLMGASHPPSFRISNPPSKQANTQLITDFLKQDRHRRGSSAQCQQDSQITAPYTSEFVRGGYSAGDPLGSCTIRPATTSDTATTQVQKHLEIVKLSGHGTKIFQISALETFALTQGRKSDTYKSVLANIKELLVDLGHKAASQDTILVLMPTAAKLAKRDSSDWGVYETPAGPLEARDAQSERPLSATDGAKKGPTGAKPPVQILASKGAANVSSMMSICYEKEDTCKNATNNCSGHGSCYRKYGTRGDDPSDCWACGCIATPVNGTSGRTVQWAGPACQKKDVSSPFWLLAGFTIFMVMTVTWGISLLYSIGEEELPSVIGAGVTGPRAQK